MPIDDLTALGQKMREARKNKELTQQELSDLSHVSVKQEMRDTLLHHTQETVKELTELSEKFETN